MMEMNERPSSSSVKVCASGWKGKYAINNDSSLGDPEPSCAVYIMIRRCGKG